MTDLPAKSGGHLPKSGGGLPAGLAKEISTALMREKRNAAAVYDLLDQKQGPVKVKNILAELHITPDQYRRVRQLLSGTSAQLYVTQNGVVLKKYVSDGDQRYWHLSWSLGLFRESGEQLVLDEDLLERAPDDIQKLVRDGKLKQKDQLLSLREKTQAVMTTLSKVMRMYKRIQGTINGALLPPIRGNLEEKKKELRKRAKALRSQ